MLPLEDVTEMAALTVRRLVERHEGGPAHLERESVLPPHLVFRGSTGRARQAATGGFLTS